MYMFTFNYRPHLQLQSVRQHQCQSFVTVVHDSNCQMSASQQSDKTIELLKQIRIGAIYEINPSAPLLNHDWIGTARKVIKCEIHVLRFCLGCVVARGVVPPLFDSTINRYIYSFIYWIMLELNQLSCLFFQLVTKFIEESFQCQFCIVF